MKTKYFLFGLTCGLIIFASMAFVGSSIINKKDCNNEQLVMATLYTQRAAEYKALCLQTYNTARIMLDDNVWKNKDNKKLAVVVDIDETVLDNSPFEAKCALTGENYPKYWEEWCNLGIAKAVPGSVEFLQYASTKGVEVFYISNRYERLKDITLKNLKNLKFPNADNDHILLSTGSSSKIERRKKVSETHNIVILVGDNLGDFDGVFEKISMDERDKLVVNLQNEFGKRFFMLPNAMYGDWEGALYDFNYKIPCSQRDSIRKSFLIAF